MARAWAAIFRDSILETFGFERGEKASHRRVIVATGFAAHARGDVVDFKRVAEVLGRHIAPRDRNDAVPEPGSVVDDAAIGLSGMPLCVSARS
jgi:hypothetical protein